MAAGYIYILANSSMPGLIKVGKTTRLPSARAEELSGVTGVATPFIVVYEEFVDDCNFVETFVHTKLATTGLRISNNREFFRASVSDVLKLILQASQIVKRNEPYTTANQAITADDQVPLNSTLGSRSSPEPWHTLMEEADGYYFGSGGTIQDYGEALDRYCDAARLGSPEAYRRLGDIYRFGYGVRQDFQKAIEYYKDGVKKNSYICWAGMTVVFLNINNIENAQKAFEQFIKSGSADSWRQAAYPGEHVDLMYWVLSAAARWPEGVVRSLMLQARNYSLQMLDRMQIDIDNPTLNAASRLIARSLTRMLREVNIGKNNV